MTLLNPGNPIVDDVKSQAQDDAALEPGPFDSIILDEAH